MPIFLIFALSKINYARTLLITSSVIIRLAITIQPTRRNRSTLDTVNGTEARLSVRVSERLE
jgi:hypothetical protein